LNYINLNGKLLAADDAMVAHDNRAFRYGYGLFETMFWKDGSIQLSDLHNARLFTGMQQLSVDIPKLMNKAWMQREVERTVQKNKYNDLCRVRMQVWPGNGGLYDATSRQPEYMIECFPLVAELTQLNEHGLHIGIANGLNKSADSIANLKTCNALIYAIAAKHAKEQKWNDALILNTSGNIIESTIANIFIIKDRQICTPPLTEGCVAGVMRQYLITIMREKGYNVVEQPVSQDDVLYADEIFLTNAIRRIKWVERLGNSTYICKQTQSIYHSIFGA